MNDIAQVLEMYFRSKMQSCLIFYLQFQFEIDYPLFNMKIVFILLVLLLGIYLEKCFVSGISFSARDSIEVNNPNGVIEVGKQCKLTCNYVINSREAIHAIRWYFSYQDTNSNYGNVSSLVLFCTANIYSQVTSICCTIFENAQ